MTELELWLNEFPIKKNHENTENEFWTLSIDNHFYINYNKSQKYALLLLNGFGVVKQFRLISKDDLISLYSLFNKY